MLVNLPHLHRLTPEERENATSPGQCGPTLALIGLGHHELFGLEEVGDARFREITEQAKRYQPLGFCPQSGPGQQGLDKVFPIGADSIPIDLPLLIYTLSII